MPPLQYLRLTGKKKHVSLADQDKTEDKSIKHKFRWGVNRFVKGAVCRILTLLKHKNTIICLQTFRKHAKLTYLFIWKTMLQSVILLWKCAVQPGMSVFVMVCETRPLPVYPIVFRHPGLPVAWKHSVFNLINCHVRLFLLVSLIWHPPHASSLRRRGWWKKRLQEFEFGLQYLVQPSILHTAPLTSESTQFINMSSCTPKYILVGLYVLCMLYVAWRRSCSPVFSWQLNSLNISVWNNFLLWSNVVSYQRMRWNSYYFIVFYTVIEGWVD